MVSTRSQETSDKEKRPSKQASSAVSIAKKKRRVSVSTDNDVTVAASASTSAFAFASASASTPSITVSNNAAARSQEDYYKSCHSGAKQFILHVLRQPKSNLADSTGLWKNLSAEWQCDREIALTAVAHNFVKSRELTASLQEDPDFLLESVRVNANEWCHLPYAVKNDPVYARAITQFKSRTLAWGVLEEIPDLCQDRDIWVTIIDSKLEGLASLVEEKAGTSICGDEDLMRKAIRQCPGILQHVSESLLHDESFFTELLCLKPRLLEHVPASTQRLFPGLIASTFSDCFMAGMPHAILAAKIAPDVMHQREVLSAWFQAGGKFIFSVFPEKWRSDQEIMGWIIEHCDEYMDNSDAESDEDEDASIH